MLGKKVAHGRLKPKKESTFGKVSKGSFGKPKKDTTQKKPCSGFNRNRKGLKKKATATSQEREYLGWIREQGHKCFVCNTSENIEFHHIKRDSTSKKNHSRVVPLCLEHHTSQNHISPHGQPKAFREKYPIEMQENFARELHSVFLEIIK